MGGGLAEDFVAAVTGEGETGASVVVDEFVGVMALVCGWDGGRLVDVPVEATREGIRTGTVLVDVATVAVLTCFTG
jgi:hypothetical protein